MTERISAGWYRDPYGRHEQRYHTGTGWTEHIKDRGKPGVDPPRGTISDEPPRRFPERIPARIRRTGERVVPEPGPTRPTPVAEPAVAHEPAAPATKKVTPVPRKPTPVKKKPAPVAKATPIPKATPARTPAPVRANGAVRAGMPAVSSTSVAVALPQPLNKRAPSAYLKPAPRMTPAPADNHQPRWPWVVVAIFVLLGFAFASGVGLIDGAATEPRTTAPAPKRAAHTITQVQYDFLVEGTTRRRVIAGLGRQPATRADYLRVYPTAKVSKSCEYYYSRVASRSYSFCFDGDDRLISKTTRSLPSTTPTVKPAATAPVKAGTKMQASSTVEKPASTR